MITFQFETKYALFGDNLLYKNDLIKDVFMPSLKGNTQCISFLAALVALHLTPVSEWVSEWAEFQTSIATRLASLLNLNPIYARHLFHDRVDVSVCALF